MPLLCIDLNGVLGYFDENHCYNIKQNVFNLLFSLSLNFRIVGYIIGVRKHYVKRLIKNLSQGTRPFVFDAVYLIK